MQEKLIVNMGTNSHYLIHGFVVIDGSRMDESVEFVENVDVGTIILGKKAK